MLSPLTGTLTALGRAPRAAAGGGGAFSPASLSGLALWLDASDASTLEQTAGGSLAGVGDPVRRWKDKSGNANHADAGALLPPAVGTYSGGPSTNGVRFLAASTTESLVTPDLTSLIATNFEITAVCANNNTSNDGNEFLAIEAGGGAMLGFTNVGGSNYARTGRSGQAWVAGSSVPTPASAIEIYSFGHDGTNTFLYHEGVLYQSANVRPATNRWLRIYRHAAVPHDGVFYEIVITDWLSSSERADLYAYLAGKWQ